jgi:hypothetical protein
MKKKAKKKKKLKKGLIKKFILIILILLIVVLCAIGGTYWVNLNKEEIIQVFTRYTYNKYRTNYDKFEVLYDNYIIEKDSDDSVQKITTFNNAVLYKNNDSDNTKYTVIEGIDNKLYLYNIDKVVNLYSLDNKYKEFVINIDKKDIVPIIYIDSNNYERLMGFYGNKTVYTLDKKQYTINDYELIGNNDKDKIITYNNREIIVKKDNKYGIYDIKENVTLINTKYDMIHNYDDTYYIAYKGKDAGIINSNDKVLLDFDYDNIKKNIVIKNDKLALLSNNFEIITKYDFKDSDNSAYVLDINKKYLLVTGVSSHLINNNGSYTTIQEDIMVCDGNNDFYYSYNDKEKEFVIYDENINKKYSIFVDKFDIKNDSIYKFGNTIIINDTYYNYETGEVLKKINRNVLELSNTKVSYNNGNIDIYLNDKKIYSYEYDIKNNKGHYMNIINNNLNNGFYIINDDELLVIRKK